MITPKRFYQERPIPEHVIDSITDKLFRATHDTDSISFHHIDRVTMADVSNTNNVYVISIGRCDFAFLVKNERPHKLVYVVKAVNGIDQLITGKQIHQILKNERIDRQRLTKALLEAEVRDANSHLLMDLQIKNSRLGSANRRGLINSIEQYNETVSILLQ